MHKWSLFGRSSLRWGRAGPADATVVRWDVRSPSISRIYAGECQNEDSLEEQERWLGVIQRQEDQGYFSEMEALIHIVGAKRLAARLHEELGSPLTREQLVALLQRIMAVDGTEEEIEAWLKLIADETGASFGSITEDIYWPKQEMAADENVERAVERGKRA